MEIHELVQVIGQMKVKDMVELTKALEEAFHVKAVRPILTQLEKRIEQPTEQTIFTIRLESYTDKVLTVKTVREMFTLGLREAMDLVNSTPTVLKTDVDKADAEAIVARLSAIGCKVTMQ